MSDAAMSDAALSDAALSDADWQTTNAHYLSAMLTWLRLRLQQVIEASPLHSPAPSPPTPTPAIAILSQQLGLSDFEQSILLLCVAIELDPQIAELCAQAQHNSNRPYPTFALALRCFDNAAWDAFSPNRPLRYWRLIEINQPAAQPLMTSPLRADERITNFVKGLNYLDDRLTSLLLPLQPTRLPALPPSQQQSVEAIVQTLKQSSWETPPLIQLVGADSLSKQLVAQQAAIALGIQLYRLPIELLPTTDLETFTRLWQRESLLLPIALYLDAHDTEASLTTGSASPLHRFLNHSQGLFFLSRREAQPPEQSAFTVDQSAFTVDIAKPTPEEQKTLWTIALQDYSSDMPAQLAAQFNLNAVTIGAIAQQSAIAAPAPLWETCLRHTRPQLDTLAQRLEPKATWDDLVLPAEETSLLHQIADQVRQRHKVYQDWGFYHRLNRGFGINALFAGESGTGKTMAAEVIANDLQLTLYRIDLSAVVSKYIGETEKNLRRLFDAAEDGGAILLFDEADALFGKRSEVKDSHDRYANIEINYLLQRIESYRGLAILATNLKNALDTAFLRRLRFILNFPFPGIRERTRLWQKAFPPETPIESLDYDRLAALNLTGGNIHTVAINAAFLAAQSGTSVTLPIVLLAARTEYRKLDRPITESDFLP